VTWIATLALVLIPLGGPFTDASASAEPLGAEMDVELVAQVDAVADVVIAHIVVGGDQPQRSVTLDDRGSGVYGGFVTLPIQEAIVVFELFAPGGGVLSDPATLTELGVDLAAVSGRDPFTPVEADPEGGITNEARRWLWLAAAAGAAALSVLAFWARGTPQDGDAEAPGDTYSPADEPAADA